MTQNEWYGVCILYRSRAEKKKKLQLEKQNMVPCHKGETHSFAVLVLL